MNNTPDISDTPETYDELNQDELKLLLYYNKYCLKTADAESAKKYYRDKIDYISSLIKD